jgi:uncharacterized glyoxalase superfamily protein PhnB
MLQQLTPVLIVPDVESCVSFWIDRMGFRQTNQVSGDNGRLVFASVEKDGIELMYQTRASVVADMPSQASRLDGHSVTLFFSVDDLDAVETAMVGAKIVKPRHKTFYGSTELYIEEPGGTMVGFAQFG